MTDKILKTSKVPNLRFPGFEGEWEIKKIKDIASKINSGKTPLGGEAVYANKGVLFIRSQNVNDNRLDIENAVFISEEINNEMKNSIVYPNDILLNITGASLGRSCVVPTGFNIGNVNQHVCIIRLIKNNNPRFLQPYFSSNKGQNTFKSLQTGSGREGLNFESIKNQKIFVPVFSEQTKIANFLVLLDSRIQTQSEIIKRYESLIKSSSQKLFELKLRFKENNRSDYPIWKERQIGKIGMILNGLTGKTKDDFGAGKFYIQYKQIFDSSKIDISKCGKVEISENEKQTIFKFGDVFFTTSSETPNEIGTASVLLNEIDEVYLNSFCFGFRADNNILNPKFSQFLFRSEIFRKKMIPLAQGSTRYNISKSVFVKLKINLPSLEEQIKIANFLNSISVKIETEKNLLEQYKDQKKYFLQNMFI